ncbi:hypothetical protein BH23BAC3_BH23BAC3_31470 [soil metagenome]
MTARPVRFFGNLTGLVPNSNPRSAMSHKDIADLSFYANGSITTEMAFLDLGQNSAMTRHYWP